MRKKPEIIGVVGAMIMGRGIAQLLVQSGHSLWLRRRAMLGLSLTREELS